MGLGDVFDDGEAKDRAPHLSAAGLVYAVEAFKKPRQMLLIYATPLVTAKIGIDISGYRTKSVNEFLDREFDYVVTGCDCAKQTCPFSLAATSSSADVSRTRLRFPEMMRRRWRHSGVSGMRYETGLKRSLVGKLLTADRSR
jgi:hypothetical protein